MTSPAQGVVSELDADTDGKHVTAGIKGGYLMPLGTVRVGPVIGLDYARAQGRRLHRGGRCGAGAQCRRARATRRCAAASAPKCAAISAAAGCSCAPTSRRWSRRISTATSARSAFAQTSAPGIVNRYRVEDGSNKAYGRLSLGASAAILSGVSLDANVSGTVGKDQGNETSGHIGLRAAF